MYLQYNSDTQVKLSSYNCDLNLEVTNGGFGCKPLSNAGFAYMWAGVKANFGIRSGRVCYEVKIEEECKVDIKDSSDIHVIRVGWSTDSATLQLGEDKQSYGFGGSGMKSEDRKFVAYGRKFSKGDVVSCYLAIVNGWADITFAVNGQTCGSAFKIRWNRGEVFYPHILTKNCVVNVNFGQNQNPYFSLLPGYKFIEHLPFELKIPSVSPPARKEDCEVIMMVGLPGVGKSTWAMNYAKIHPSKKYNVLGTDAIIEKMRILGLRRKSNFGVRWDVLIKEATECFNTLLKKAARSVRNLILDQTNVYSSARQRKVKQFKDAGFIVNAMVLVPTDEDMVARSLKRTREEGKEIPEDAILDMKANFSLPDEGEGLFEAITYLELQREEAVEVVKNYNLEAENRGRIRNPRQKQFNPNQMDKAMKNPSPSKPLPVKREPIPHKQSHSPMRRNHPSAIHAEPPRVPFNQQSFESSLPPTSFYPPDQQSNRDYPPPHRTTAPVKQEYDTSEAFNPPPEKMPRYSDPQLPAPKDQSRDRQPPTNPPTHPPSSNYNDYPPNDDYNEGWHDPYNTNSRDSFNRNNEVQYGSGDRQHQQQHSYDENYGYQDQNYDSKQRYQPSSQNQQTGQQREYDDQYSGRDGRYNDTPQSSSSSYQLSQDNRQYNTSNIKQEYHPPNQELSHQPGKFDQGHNSDYNLAYDDKMHPENKDQRRGPNDNWDSPNNRRPPGNNAPYGERRPPDSRAPPRNSCQPPDIKLPPRNNSKASDNSKPTVNIRNPPDNFGGPPDITGHPRHKGPGSSPQNNGQQDIQGPFGGPRPRPPHSSFGQNNSRSSRPNFSPNHPVKADGGRFGSPGNAGPIFPNPESFGAPRGPPSAGPDNRFGPQNSDNRQPQNFVPTGNQQRLRHPNFQQQRAPSKFQPRNVPPQNRPPHRNRPSGPRQQHPSHQDRNQGYPPVKTENMDQGYHDNNYQHDRDQKEGDNYQNENYDNYHDEYQQSEQYYDQNTGNYNDQYTDYPHENEGKYNENAYQEQNWQNESSTAKTHVKSEYNYDDYQEQQYPTHKEPEQNQSYDDWQRQDSRNQTKYPTHSHMQNLPSRSSGGMPSRSLGRMPPRPTGGIPPHRAPGPRGLLPPPQGGPRNMAPHSSAGMDPQRNQNQPRFPYKDNKPNFAHPPPKFPSNQGSDMGKSPQPNFNGNRRNIPPNNRGNPPKNNQGNPPLDSWENTPYNNRGNPPFDHHGKPLQDNRSDLLPNNRVNPPLDKHGNPPFNKHGNPPHQRNMQRSNSFEDRENSGTPRRDSIGDEMSHPIHPDLPKLTPDEVAALKESLTKIRKEKSMEKDKSRSGEHSRKDDYDIKSGGDRRHQRSRSPRRKDHYSSRDYKDKDRDHSRNKSSSSSRSRRSRSKERLSRSRHDDRDHESKDRRRDRDRSISRSDRYEENKSRDQRLAPPPKNAPLLQEPPLPRHSVASNVPPNQQSGMEFKENDFKNPAHNFNNPQTSTFNHLDRQFPRNNAKNATKPGFGLSDFVDPKDRDRLNAISLQVSMEMQNVNDEKEPPGKSIISPSEFLKASGRSAVGIRPPPVAVIGTRMKMPGNPDHPFPLRFPMNQSRPPVPKSFHGRNAPFSGMNDQLEQQTLESIHVVEEEQKPDSDKQINKEVSMFTEEELAMAQQQLEMQNELQNPQSQINQFQNFQPRFPGDFPNHHRPPLQGGPGFASSGFPPRQNVPMRFRMPPPRGMRGRGGPFRGNFRGMGPPMRGGGSGSKRGLLGEKPML